MSNKYLIQTILSVSLFALLQVGTAVAGSRDGEEDTQKKSVSAKQNNYNNNNVNSSEEERKTPRIVLLMKEPLTEKAKDLAYWDRVLEVMGPKANTFATAHNLGVAALRNVNVNGYESSLIIIDDSFEPDVATLVQGPRNFTWENGKTIAHGTSVSITAASTYPEGDALAYGSGIFPICWMNPKPKQDLDQWYDEQSKKILESGRVDVRPLMENLLKLYEIKLKLLTPGTLNHDVLDKVEGALAFCHANSLPLPHVLNMSLSFDADPREANDLIQRLTSLLHNNDMLLVTSAGNDGKDILPGMSSESGIERDLLGYLPAFPDLIERMIIVGAFIELDLNEAADFSNRAAGLKDHTLFAHGMTNVTLFNAAGKVSKTELVEGTSFASPRVASMAVVLKKYFPHLSMVEVKDILLKTAFKPEGCSEAVFGQGALHPLMAWIEALKLEANPEITGKKKGLGAKLKSLLFKRKE